MTVIDNLKIGEDGRIYFHYNKGMTFRLKQQNGEIHTFKIEYCVLKNDKEYFIIRRENDDFVQSNSLKRMSFWLRTQLLEVIDDGEPQELPLLLKEVQVFYAVQASQRKARKAEISAKLKNTRYDDIKKELKKIELPLIFSEVAATSERPAQDDINAYKILKERSDTLNAELQAIYKAVGLTANDFESFKVCENCNGFGIVSGQICGCAMRQATAIKTYNAAQRMLALKKEVI